MTQTPTTIWQLPDLGAAQGTDRAVVDRLGTPVSAGAFVVGQAYQIVTVGNTNFTTIGAESNEVGAYFVATGVGTGSGTAAPINTGDVALSAVAALVTKAGLGLDAVNNTSDADKPVSTAVQTALAGKANAGAIGSSGLTMGPGILLRETGTGAPQVYSLGSGLSVVGGALVVTSGGTGTVTSVGLSAPTGFTVTGSPVNGSGTLALGFALGYSLPTDARQGDWDTAFAQRRHWDGGSQHLDAAVGRASLGLDTAAQSPTTAFATAAQGAKADTAVQPATLASGLAGKADLVGGVVPSSQIPAIAISDFLGSVSSQSAMLALVGQRGDWCIRTDGNTAGAWILSAEPSSLLANWVQIPMPAVPVQSVNGQVGVITLGAADVGAAPAVHSQAWSTITSTPTTLNGYGITDGFTQAQVRATPLSGFVSTPGTVAATDTILQAFQKIVGNTVVGTTSGTLCAGDDARVVNAMRVVNHGSAAGTARPAGAAAVYWVGTVEPANALDNDLWIGGV